MSLLYLMVIQPAHLWSYAIYCTVCTTELVMSGQVGEREYVNVINSKSGWWPSQPGNELFKFPHCTALHFGTSSLGGWWVSLAWWHQHGWSERGWRRKRRCSSGSNTGTTSSSGVKACEVRWRHMIWPISGFKGGGVPSVNRQSPMLLTPSSASSRTAFSEHCWNQFLPDWSLTFCSLSIFCWQISLLYFIIFVTLIFAMKCKYQRIKIRTSWVGQFSSCLPKPTCFHFGRLFANIQVEKT